jgi:uncharacterized protein (UPF0335 family)
MFNCKKVNRKKNIEFIDKINKLEVENKQLQDKILILEK